MSRALRGSVSLFALLAALSAAPGRAVAQAPSVAVSLDKANLVVRGKVLSLRDGSLRLRIDRAILGTSRDAELTVAVPEAETEGATAVQPTVDGYGLLFLNQTREGIAVADPEHFWFPLREGIPSVPEPLTPRQQLRREFHFTSSGPRSPARFVAARQLGFLPAEAGTLTHLRGFLKSDDLELAGAAIEALLRLNQPDAVALALEFEQRLNELAPDAKPERATALLVGLRNGVRELRDTRAIEPLQRLLSHKDVRWRRSAAMALARIPEGACIPALVRALDDSDELVRYAAAGGLAHVTLKRNPRPSDLNDFRKNEAKYVAYWKQWWATEARSAFEEAGQKAPPEGGKP
jgi:hypothetical protein